MTMTVGLGRGDKHQIQQAAGSSYAVYRAGLHYELVEKEMNGGKNCKISDQLSVPRRDSSEVRAVGSADERPLAAPVQREDSL